MSISGLLLRFAGVYIALLLCLAIVFGLLGLKTNTGINAGALVTAVLGACFWFASKNKRYLKPSEKRSAVFGMWAIDLGLQIIMALAAGAVAGIQLSLGPMLVGASFVGLLHAAVIYFTVGLAGNEYVKQWTKNT